MKKIIDIFAISLSTFVLFGCNTRSQTNSTVSNSSSVLNSNKTTDKVLDVNSNTDSNKTDETNESKALVVYFSATNHTEAVASTIATHISSPIYELEPVNPYTSDDLNYSNSNSRVVKEHQTTQSGNRVNVELTNTKFDEFDDATYIFLSAPVWWQQLSWVIENFVSENDFSNKTIIPFGTSASSGFNLNNLTPLTEDDENVTWLSPQRFRSSASSSDVINWVDSLGYFSK